MLNGRIIKSYHFSFLAESSRTLPIIDIPLSGMYLVYKLLARSVSILTQDEG